MAHMLDEIRQQPHTLARTLAAATRTASRFRALLERDGGKRRPKLIVFVARGTSDNAAQFGRYLLEITTGIPVSLAAPSVYTLYGKRLQLKDALVIGISQSGESTDTNVVLESARKAGALTVGITNEASSAMTKIADEVFLVRAGREKSVAATKTYTGQVMMLYLIAWALGAKLDWADFERIPELTAAALQLEAEVAGLAARYHYMRHAVVMGRGFNYANAQEFALKMMETSYVVAERFSSADFLHGPIAMVEPNFPAFLFAPSGKARDSIREMLARLQALKAETVVITDRSNRGIGKLASSAITLPASIPEIYTPIPYIVPAQIFAASLAAEKKLNPDQPRTLQKITRTL
jgi:glutamine---fructose-6-phosphate transaminase (isomerizing)